MRIAMVVMVDWVRVQPEFLFQNVVHTFLEQSRGAVRVQVLCDSVLCVF